MESKLRSPDYEKVKATKGQVSWLLESRNTKAWVSWLWKRGVKESSPPSWRVMSNSEKKGSEGSLTLGRITTPYAFAVLNSKPEGTPVCLADHSLRIITLMFQSLDKPLLPVADLCDLDFTATMFTIMSWKIYPSKLVEIQFTPLDT
ncbi:hypothetical protein VP01_835g3 [Puccinia sorghi]|uniref:Uncharacterized protein n=1 Tax=Puccinia sorghi TaxID=27349 RepID=A0A0L6U9P0_9BASI|nr:hypothetical protein VP01_835g3 [Puccinia sorghi]